MSAFGELYNASVQLSWRRAVVIDKDSCFPLAGLITESVQRALDSGAKKENCSVAVLLFGNWASNMRHILIDALLEMFDVELGCSAGMILLRIVARLLVFVPPWTSRTIGCCCTNLGWADFLLCACRLKATLLRRIGAKLGGENGFADDCCEDKSPNGDALWGCPVVLRWIVDPRQGFCRVGDNIRFYDRGC